MPSISRTPPARITGSRSRALVLATAACLLALALSPAVVSAAGGRDSRNAENTFTKYISTYPVMAGVVGGDVGVGTYAGEILSLDVTNTGLVIDAVYDFEGSTHSFTAIVHVVQTGFTDGSTATITGRVTSGWLKGNQVSGQYTQITCEQTPGVFGTCFQGTLDVLRGSKVGS
jgi:hypothetical protein